MAMKQSQSSRAMKLNNSIVMRHIGFFIVLVFIVLVLATVVFLLLIAKAKTTEDGVKINKRFNEEILSGIESKANLLAPLSSSATKLAKLLSTSVNQTKLSFPTIESKVAPLLFQAFSTIPYLSQVSYFGTDDLLFSYYSKEKQQPFAVYSNSSISINQNKSTNISWYSQPVSHDTGKLYGEAVTYPPSTITNTSTLRLASLGTSWNDPQDFLFLNTAVMDGRGAISLGFHVKSLTKFLSGFNGTGGSLYFATKDGEVIREGMIPNTRLVMINSSSFLIQLVNSYSAQIGQVGTITCKQNDGALRKSILNIWDTEYMLYCSPLKIVGVELVYVLAIPLKRSQSFVHNFNNVAVVVLVMVAAMFVSITYFVIIIVQGERTEMNLRAALIKQMETTQRAEKKSLNKSNAFANASHDVRASLAGIAGLIEICHELVDPKSELEANLVQMKSCTNDLLGILNTILDTSKIESGKMQLEEEEFEVAQLLEDVADLFHSVGMKKGVDVVLDLYDGSVVKFSHVKGDRGKLRQILCNLVSNAVKFTSEGHVSIRAYARKWSSDNSVLTKTQSNLLTWFSCLFSKANEAYNEHEATEVQQDKKCMEFVFEVDDTGKGIPKEKAKSVFENYVQVKETSIGQEGTGLGLNIVQSLVRLMGGEIVIKDKEVGRKGTCFKFNTYLTICETRNIICNAREYDIESHGDYISGESKYFSPPITQKHSPRVGALMVLFIQSEERRRVSKKYMERLGIKVLAVKNYEQFSSALKHIKQKLLLSTCSSSERSNLSSRSDCRRVSGPHNYSTRMKEVPLSALDGTDLVRPTPRTDTKSALNFITIVIDTDGLTFRELSKAVVEFRKDLCHIYTRVVWIDKPGTRNIQFQGLDKDKLPPSDLIISKPFHGSRLYQVIGISPKLCAIEATFPQPMQKETIHSSPRKFPSDSKPTTTKTRPGWKQNYSSTNLPNLQGEIKELGDQRNEKPLKGKSVLVAEDDLVLQKIASSVISKLGASVDICGNGEEALEIVRKNLNHQRKQGNVEFSPYDYIFMDCQMPIMNGFEATREIRKEEGHYGVHIPIIALSAQTSDPEIRMMIQAGMDHHLPKPLNSTQLLQVLMDIHGR